MTWVSHSIVAVSVASLVGSAPADVVVAAFASRLPDQLEIIPFLGHRGWSHSIAVWSVITIIVALMDPASVIYLLGPLSHIVADALSISGIPVFGRRSRMIRLPLYRTGRLSELVAVFAIAGVAILRHSF